MDRYKAIAKEFFETFEGTQHYPKRWNKAWLLWLLSIISGILSWWYADGTPLNLFFLLPAVLLAAGAYNIVTSHKKKSLSERFKTFGNLDEARISEIKRLIGKDRYEFDHAAQSLIQLMELSKQCGRQPLSTRDLFPIPWAKGQFIMHALTVAALIATLLGVMFPDAAKEMGKQIAQNYLGHLFAGIFITVFLGLTIFPMSRSMWHNFKLALAMWQARLQRGPVSTRVHLDYLLANLVRLHDPHPIPSKHATATTRRLRPRPRHRN